MAGKKIVTKEGIIKAAFEIVRAEGIDALNMRSLAKACNCSTQPIYLSFKSADEVKTEVLKLALKTYNDYIWNEPAEKYEIPYKAVGMGYIRFAKEESELFKWLFMRARTKELNSMDSSFGDSVRLIMDSLKINEDRAQRLQLEMWVFVHGIGTLLATRFVDWSEDEIGSLLTDAFIGIYKRIMGE